MQGNVHFLLNSDNHITTTMIKMQDNSVHPPKFPHADPLWSVPPPTPLHTFTTYLALPHTHFRAFGRAVSTAWNIPLSDTYLHGIFSCFLVLPEQMSYQTGPS